MVPDCSFLADGVRATTRDIAHAHGRSGSTNVPHRDNRYLTCPHASANLHASQYRHFPPANTIHFAHVYLTNQTFNYLATHAHKHPNLPQPRSQHLPYRCPAS